MNKEIYESNKAELDYARAKLFRICDVYKKSKHGLELAKKILFFKPKWAAVIGLLIAALDEICDQ